ncbi:MAG TPA: ATP-binding protein [Streptosporangiaceae bacterium]
MSQDDHRGDAELDEADAVGLARALRELLEGATRTLARTRGDSPLVARVTGHIDRPLAAVLAVTHNLPPWEHINLQRGVDAYLEAHEGGEWFGVAGRHRGHDDLLGLLSVAERHGEFELGSADYGTAATGPDSNAEVVMLGLVTATAPDGAPVVIGLRQASDFGPPVCRLEVMAANRESATLVREEIDRLRRLHDVFRGQVLSFGYSEHHGNELVTFLPRLPLTAGQVVLPAGLLELVENHAVGIGEHAAGLLAAGQHLKRGLLLHGPPGTGKTHTVRYLIGRLQDRTVLLLTGQALRFVEQAAALARRLQPSLVVLEDVDLVAADRDFTDGNPVLFSLLDAMDGVGSDADVAFVLTTNRPDILERALADRPGRVDLAVEIPRPDQEGRERLLRLYATTLAPETALDSVVAATEGVTASYIKEIVRRAVLAALREGLPADGLDEAHLAAAVAEMDTERQALTRSLLGAAPQDGEEQRPGRPSPVPRPGRHPGGWSVRSGRRPF